mgnify:CR=1 FL=1
MAMCGTAKKKQAICHRCKRTSALEGLPKLFALGDCAGPILEKNIRQGSATGVVEPFLKCQAAFLGKAEVHGTHTVYNQQGIFGCFAVAAMDRKFLANWL